MEQSSYVIRKERCPKCEALGKDQTGDNLAIYSDGHSYCYSCGYLGGSSSLSRFLSRKCSTGGMDKREHQLYLPSDSDTNYPTVALDWIKQYGLNCNDLLNNHVLWSASNSRLIFPVYDSSMGLIAYQGRYFGPPASAGSKPYPKWYGKGDLANCYNILGKSGTSIVLTEDIISSIKVSKIRTAMPLYGSFISDRRFKHLKLLGYKDIYIFLDPDKRKEALKFSRLGKLLGVNTKIIYADADPKELEYSELKIVLDFRST